MAWESNIFLWKRICKEMIIFRPKGEAFSSISWKLLKQECIQAAERVYDKLVFEITAFTEKDWEELKAEYEGPERVGSPKFEFSAHQKRRQEKMIRFERKFWFDITSFHGRGVVITDKITGKKMQQCTSKKERLFW